MKSEKKSRDIAIALLLLGLLFLILSLISLDSRETVSREAPLPVVTAKPVDLINKHMQEVLERQEIDQKAVENINYLKAPSLKDAPTEVPLYHFNEIPLVFDQDAISEMVGEDLRVFATQSLRRKSLSQQIQQEVIDDIKRAAAEESYKKALAEAIIQKARSQGYEVTVNDEYKVTSVRRIVKKEEKSLFAPDSIPNK
jgi:hypothetical protein